MAVLSTNLPLQPFPYTTLFRSVAQDPDLVGQPLGLDAIALREHHRALDRVLELAHVAGPWVVEEQRSEEHTSELQSRRDLVCRLLLEKKKVVTAVNRTQQHYNI